MEQESRSLDNAAGPAPGMAPRADVPESPGASPFENPAGCGDAGWHGEAIEVPFDRFPRT